MPRKKKAIEFTEISLKNQSFHALKKFYYKFLTPAQEDAWNAFKENEVLFLIGSAGTGKSFLAVAFALNEILEGKKEKILLTRPAVEAGESLGFLPGGIDEKIYPYMLPIYDCLENFYGKGPDAAERKEYVHKKIKLAPLAFLRGRTFLDSICILDEAQNCSKTQLKLFLSRLGENSKLIITGDPSQSDLKTKQSDLLNVAEKLSDIPGIATIYFNEDSIVRHPLVAEILRRLP